MKVFISQPITGLTEKQVLSTRNKAIYEIIKLYGRDVEILNSYFVNDYRTQIENTMQVKRWDIFWLSQSLEIMSNADLIWMCNGWQNSKGCNIERNCAKLYGIPIAYSTKGE